MLSIIAFLWAWTAAPPPPVVHTPLTLAAVADPLGLTAIDDTLTLTAVEN